MVKTAAHHQSMLIIIFCGLMDSEKGKDGLQVVHKVCDIYISDGSIDKVAFEAHTIKIIT
jgi:hypothetical protein